MTSGKALTKYFQAPCWSSTFVRGGGVSHENHVFYRFMTLSSQVKFTGLDGHFETIYASKLKKYVPIRIGLQLIMASMSPWMVTLVCVERVVALMSRALPTPYTMVNVGTNKEPIHPITNFQSSKLWVQVSWLERIWWSYKRVLNCVKTGT